LGPLRPFFLAVATAGQVWTWQLYFQVEPHFRERSFNMTVASSVLTVSLTFLPELLYLRLHWLDVY